MCWREVGSAGAGWCFCLPDRPNSALAAGELFFCRLTASPTSGGRGCPGGGPGGSRWAVVAGRAGWELCEPQRPEGGGRLSGVRWEQWFEKGFAGRRETLRWGDTGVNSGGSPEEAGEKRALPGPGCCCHGTLRSRVVCCYSYVLVTVIWLLLKMRAIVTVTTEEEPLFSVQQIGDSQ